MVLSVCVREEDAGRTVAWGVDAKNHWLLIGCYSQAAETGGRRDCEQDGYFLEKFPGRLPTLGSEWEPAPLLDSLSGVDCRRTYLGCQDEGVLEVYYS